MKTEEEIIELFEKLNADHQQKLLAKLQLLIGDRAEISGLVFEI